MHIFYDLNKKIVPIIIIVLLSFFCINTDVQAEKYDIDTKIRVGGFISDNHFYLDTEGVYAGYVVEYFDKLSLCTGWQYEYKVGTLEQCLLWLEKGEVDIVFNLNTTPEREEIFDFSKYIYGYERLILLTKKSNTVYDELDHNSFNNMRVGMLRGSFYISQFEAYAVRKGITFTEKLYGTEEEIKEALKNNEVDAICLNNSDKVDNLRVLHKFELEPTYFAVKNGNNELLEQLNYAIKETMDNDVNKLWEKYHDSYFDLDIALTEKEQSYIAEAGVIPIAINTDTLPLEGIDKSGHASGLVVEVLKRITKLTGLRFDYINVTDSEEKYELLHSQMTIAMSSENSEHGIHNKRTSITYFAISTVMLGYNNDKIQEHNIEKKDKIKIGMMPLTEFTKEEIKEKYENCTFYDYNALEDAYKDIKSKYIDYIVVNAHTMIDLLLQDSNIDILSSFKEQKKYSFVFSDSIPAELITIFNKCMLTLSDDEKCSYVHISAEASHEEHSSINSVLHIILTFILVLVLLYLLYLFLKFKKNVINMAYFDGLTGSKNLSKFTADAEKLKKMGTLNKYVLVVFDIKNFSLYNAMYTKEKGDQLLKVIVQMLEFALNDRETFGRIGMDNFVLLLEYGSENIVEKRMKALLKRINNLNSNSPIRLACGCCILSNAEVSIEQAFEGALVAHKLAKNNKGLMDIYYFDDHDKDFYDFRNKIHLIESNMEKAINDGEFRLYMQPQYDTISEKIVGVETLVRWMRDGKFLYFPNEFITIFENNGFITELDHYIFEEACKVLKFWYNHNIEPVNISINVSRRNFSNKNFPYELEEIANKYGVSCNSFTIEITEYIATSNEEISRECQQLLRGMGFRLSIDDFGTGYSALSVLKDIIVDEVKLDKSFFYDILEDENARNVVQSILNLVKELNLTSVAEGIETKEQIDFLKGTHCDLIQGYYYARPMPVYELNKLLLSRNLDIE